jgi:hypothetical protein
VTFTEFETQSDPRWRTDLAFLMEKYHDKGNNKITEQSYKRKVKSHKYINRQYDTNTWLWSIVGDVLGKYHDLSRLTTSFVDFEIEKAYSSYYKRLCLTPIQLSNVPSWSWSYGSWIYNYLCNQCDKVCQWLAAGRWISPGIPVSSTNKLTTTI